jgi:hypothetical protein
VGPVPDPLLPRNLRVFKCKTLNLFGTEIRNDVIGNTLPLFYLWFSVSVNWGSLCFVFFDRSSWAAFVLLLNMMPDGD